VNLHDTRSVGAKDPAPAAVVEVDATSPLLVDALGQSELLKEKVEQCVADLSEVNEVLHNEVAGTTPQPVIRRAMTRNADLEAKVQECADDLAAINDVLEAEIDERHVLDQELISAAAALEESRSKADAALHRALHDQLTGLPNAGLFDDRLAQAISQAKRRKSCLAVMFIDLDRFKEVNDRYGHGMGDNVLKTIADRLLLLVRGGDSVARRSGDEFLFLMLDVHNEANVIQLARKIIARLAQKCEFGGNSVEVRPSIGIAMYPAHGLLAADLLAKADAAMYAAKKGAEGFAIHRA
jgi:diguanylate cyclase (GGDEF)-like protein